jgi:tetratricopeptide (TPR) repeat protein
LPGLPTDWLGSEALDRDEEVARAIRQRDLESVMRLMFTGDLPTPRSGFRTETELWDFKGDSPRLGREGEAGWAEIASDVLAFHNHRGGILVFGVTDDFSFSGVRTRLDSKLFNDQLRKFLGDTIWVEFQREYVSSDQRYLGMALIPQRGPAIERFRSDAPTVRGRRRFQTGDSAIRQGDSTRILRRAEADKFARELSVPTVGRVYSIDEPFFRILAPEYEHFVYRPRPCKAIETAIGDPRTAVAAVIGIGGAGKTALATWAVSKAYDRGDFQFITSITAKDRELTPAGIRALEPSLTSFETLLDSVLDTLGFSEIKSKDVESKEAEVHSLIENSHGLIYVDNLETVSDARIIEFLDTLPVGVRAVITSRRAKVRVSVYPVDLEPLTDEEMIEFIATLKDVPGTQYVVDLSPPERVRIGHACDGIPLAIRWALARSRSASEAIANAEGITAAGHQGEELLEFCFRRVFEALTDEERKVLQVLSLFQRPLTTESITAGSRLPGYVVFDALDDLVAEALAQRFFDPDKNDYSYALLPVTRAFVYTDVAKQRDLEREVRRAMSDWFEARDVTDAGQRLVIREVRQGNVESESSLLDLGRAAERTGDLRSAQDFYEKALQRNSRSWKAARLLAEFFRHKLRNQAEALRLYEQAAANAPRRGPDRALIFREWGMLLRDSGDPQATELAIEKFEAALVETPNDVLAIHALSHMLDRKGAYRRVIDLLEPLAKHPSLTTRTKALPLLANAYQRMGEMLKAAEVRREIEALGQDISPTR